MLSNKHLILLCATIFCGNIMIMVLIAKVQTVHKFSLIISKDQQVLAFLPEDYLSIGIDTSEIEKYDKIDFTSKRLRAMASELAPARLRLGGTMSDRLIFSKDDVSAITCEMCDSSASSEYICAYVNEMCKLKPLPFFIMTGRKFREINEFCKETNLKLLFTLNLLLRTKTQWNDLNAQDLLLFTVHNNYSIDWQLGNEPNSFPHVFNVTITPEQLGLDFKKLQSLLHQHHYKNSLLVGPDTTRPQPHRPQCLKYMVEFLGNASDIINVRSWHQYYLNSRTAELEDFWKVETFNLLDEQINTMENHTLKYQGIPMWLTETSSSYGGGAPGLSNTYAATPLWLDKLGLAAKHNITTVIRQSFIGGNYSLLDKDLNPLPDWWVSVLYKRLVGNKVLNIDCNCTNKQRFYIHCTKHGYVNDTTAVTMYGINLYEETVHFALKGSALRGDNLSIDEYIIRAPSNNRKTTVVLLNGWPLFYDTKVKLHPKVLMYGKHVSMPPYSIGFWVIKNTSISICK